MADTYSKMVRCAKWGLPTAAIAIASSLFLTAKPVQRPAPSVTLSQLPSTAEIGIGRAEHHSSGDDDVPVFMRADKVTIEDAARTRVSARHYFASLGDPIASTPVEVTANTAEMIGNENRVVLSGAVNVRLPNGQEVRSDLFDIHFEKRVAEARGRIHTRDETLDIYADRMNLTWTPDSDIGVVTYSSRVRTIYIPRS